MRHRVSHRKLGRVTEHRIAMLRNQATALLRHEHIETTVPKAKELRPFVERLITIAKRGLAAGDGQRQGRCTRAAWSCATSRIARSSSKLFDTIAPRFEARPGGYTRMLRLGYRRGDSAEVAQIELVGSEYNPNAETEARPRPRRSRSRRAWAAGCARRPNGCAARRPSRRRGRRRRRPRRPSRRARRRKGAKPTRAARPRQRAPRKAGGAQGCSSSSRLQRKSSRRSRSGSKL